MTCISFSLACKCNEKGSVSSQCNDAGMCTCKANTQGTKCDSCIDNHFGFPDCKDCKCDKTGSTSLQCLSNGSCVCKAGFAGAKCSECGDLKNCNVKCTLTIDNIVNSVSYNGSRLYVTGNTNLHTSENSITFESCSKLYPGALTIDGTDLNSDRFCYWGGLLLHCIADDASNPWHNFVSDQDHWKVSDGSIPCADPASWLMNRNEPFIVGMYNAGAKSIWANAARVSLIGKPDGSC